MNPMQEALARMLETMTPQQVETVYRELLLSKELARGSSPELLQAMEDKSRFLLQQRENLHKPFSVEDSSGTVREQTLQDMAEEADQHSLAALGTGVAKFFKGTADALLGGVGMVNPAVNKLNDAYTLTTGAVETANALKDGDGATAAAGSMQGLGGLDKPLEGIEGIAQSKGFQQFAEEQQGFAQLKILGHGIAFSQAQDEQDFFKMSTQAANIGAGLTESLVNKDLGGHIGKGVQVVEGVNTMMEGVADFNNDFTYREALNKMFDEQVPKMEAQQQQASEKLTDKYYETFTLHQRLSVGRDPSTDGLLKMIEETHPGISGRIDAAELQQTGQQMRQTVDFHIRTSPHSSGLQALEQYGKPAESLVEPGLAEPAGEQPAGVSISSPQVEEQPGMPSSTEGIDPNGGMEPFMSGSLVDPAIQYPYSDATTIDPAEAIPAGEEETGVDPATEQIPESSLAESQEGALPDTAPPATEIAAWAEEGVPVSGSEAPAIDSFAGQPVDELVDSVSPVLGYLEEDSAVEAEASAVVPAEAAYSDAAVSATDNYSFQSEMAAGDPYTFYYPSDEEEEDTDAHEQGEQETDSETLPAEEQDSLLSSETAESDTQLASVEAEGPWSEGADPYATETDGEVTDGSEDPALEAVSAEDPGTYDVQALEETGEETNREAEEEYDYEDTEDTDETLPEDAVSAEMLSGDASYEERLEDVEEEVMEDALEEYEGELPEDVAAAAEDGYEATESAAGSYDQQAEEAAGGQEPSQDPGTQLGEQESPAIVDPGVYEGTEAQGGVKQLGGVSNIARDTTDSMNVAASTGLAAEAWKETDPLTNSASASVIDTLTGREASLQSLREVLQEAAAAPETEDGWEEKGATATANWQEETEGAEAGAEVGLEEWEEPVADEPLIGGEQETGEESDLAPTESTPVDSTSTEAESDEQGGKSLFDMIMDDFEEAVAEGESPEETPETADVETDTEEESLLPAAELDSFDSTESSEPEYEASADSYEEESSSLEESSTTLSYEETSADDSYSSTDDSYTSSSESYESASSDYASNDSYSSPSSYDTSSYDTSSYDSSYSYDSSGYGSSGYDSGYSSGYSSLEEEEKKPQEWDSGGSEFTSDASSESLAGDGFSDPGIDMSGGASSAPSGEGTASPQ